MVHFSRALPFAAALLLGAAGPALAQGTAEQQEACAPDAVRLCQDTIPDVEPTKACMRRHIAELSPRCRTAFNAATGGDALAPRDRVERDEDFDDAPPRDRRAARSAPRVDEDDDYGPRSYQYLTPDGDPADTSDARER